MYGICHGCYAAECNMITNKQINPKLVISRGRFELAADILPGICCGGMHS